MKKSGIIFAAIMLFAAGSLCARVLTLGGSDILRSVVEDGVAQSAKRAGLEVKFDMRGTYLAMPALEKDQCDAAVIALPRGKSLPEGYVGIPFAYQIAVVAVNAPSILIFFGVASVRKMSPLRVSASSRSIKCPVISVLRRKVMVI